ncbi:MAG: hypothetical protein WD042_13195 [Phycisphaeraceae bacterium]
MKMLSIAASYIVLVIASFLLVGCNEPDTLHRGRVDSTETSAGEPTSAQIYSAAMLEFADQVAADLPQKLIEIPDLWLRNGDKPTVIMGDINNKTYVVSSNDFEVVRSRIRHGLLQSPHVRQRVNFVENRARMEALSQREQVGTTQGAGGPEPYDARTAWALNGDFYRIHRESGRGDTNQYYMEFTLTNFATNQVLAMPKYELKQ